MLRRSPSPAERRIYSNTGFEVLAATVANQAEMPFAEYLEAAVLAPLGLEAELRGSPAAGLYGTLDDLLRFGAEVQRPTLIAAETLAEATTVQFPGLNGVLPDVGRLEPNDWGLGFELRDAKEPHWTGTRNSPRTYGHFGGSGSFLWFDPEPRPRARVPGGPRLRPVGARGLAGPLGRAFSCSFKNPRADWLTEWTSLGDRGSGPPGIGRQSRRWCLRASARSLLAPRPSWRAARIRGT